jgi:hypothetical protein
MDRNKGQGITKSQTGFFRIVVIPMFKIMVQAFPLTMPLLQVCVLSMNGMKGSRKGSCGGNSSRVSSVLSPRVWRLPCSYDGCVCFIRVIISK